MSRQESRREVMVRTRRALASWQKGALETRYHAVRAIEEDAVAAYGALAAKVDAEAEARQAQAEAYEAIGAYRYVGECKISAYCCEPYAHICGDGDGLTATGIPASPGVVAVDPEVIPLGSTVIIDGQAYLAADTGGAVQGLHVDVAMATHQEADAFGIRWADVWIMEEE